MFFCKLYKILKNTYFVGDLLLKYFFFENIKKMKAWPISDQRFLSVPTESFRKSEIFLC